MKQLCGKPADFANARKGAQRAVRLSRSSTQGGSLDLGRLVKRRAKSLAGAFAIPLQFLRELVPCRRNRPTAFQGHTKVQSWSGARWTRPLAEVFRLDRCVGDRVKAESSGASNEVQGPFDRMFPFSANARRTVQDFASRLASTGFAIQPIG